MIVCWRYRIPGMPHHNNDKNKVINPKPYANMRTDKMCLATKNFINELGKELNVTNTCCLLECQERILRDSLEIWNHKLDRKVCDLLTVGSALPALVDKGSDNVRGPWWCRWQYWHSARFVRKSHILLAGTDNKRHRGWQVKENNRDWCWSSGRIVESNERLPLSNLGIVRSIWMEACGT